MCNPSLGLFLQDSDKGMSLPRSKRKSLGLKRHGKYLSIVIVFFLGAYSTVDAAAGECPFLTTIGKSSQTVSSDLWDFFAGVEREALGTTAERDLRKRYHHYKSGSGYQYEHNRRKRAHVYTSLADIWLCLACAVGWTVWLVSATRSQNAMEPSVFESQESRKIIGNVLQVTLGEDPDGTGIPIYHTLVDYVVESDEVDEEPLQVRKCFATGKLLEEGFANVEVLVLVEDPTTSTLMEDHVLDMNERAQRQQQKPDLVYTIMVYIIAAVLITTSLVGGIHAYFRLDPEQEFWGKVSLGVGTVLLYPVAVLCYYIIKITYRWAMLLIQRPGVIVHGAQRYWSRKCGATLNPLEVMGTFDGDNFVASRSPASSPRHMSPKFTRRTTSLSSVLELSQVTTNSNVSGEGNMRHSVPRSPMYPNAGCGLGDFNVLIRTPKGKNDSNGNGLDLNTRSISSVSSGGTGAARSTDTQSTRRMTVSDRATLTSASASLQIPDAEDLGSKDSTSLDRSTGLAIRPTSRGQTAFGSYVPPPIPTFNKSMLSPGIQSSAPTPLASNLQKTKSPDDPKIV